jgi:N utilization substance protein A
MSDSKIVYDASILSTMKLFENITHARLKDCIVEEERIIFIVSPGDLMKSLGRNAEHVKRLAEKLKKKIKVVEFNSELFGFIKNFIHPLKVDAMHEEEGIVVLESSDSKVKGLLIGRAAHNLRKLEEYVKRYFPQLKEIKVV